MAASSSDATKTCCMCFGLVKGRTYRSVTSDVSKHQWGPIFTQLGAKLNGYLCNVCVNKLNRVSRLEDESKSKVQQILLEKEKLMNILSDMSGVKQSRIDFELTSKLHVPATTPKENKKRPLHMALTPNTVTPKSKRGLFVTPRKKVTPKVLKQKPNLEDKSTQTKTISSDYVVKVMVKSIHKEHTYIVHDTLQQKLIKVLIHKGTESAFCKHLSKKRAYRAAMTEVVQRQIIKEMQEIVKRRETILRCSNNEALFNFDWNSTHSLLEKKMPTLMSMLKCAVIRKKKCSPHIVMAASILLYARNQTINLIQYILGIILDSSGLTKEGLNIVHQIGLTVSHTSIYNKKKELICKQEENIEKVVKSYVQKRLSKADVNELVNVSDEPVPIEVLGDNLDVTVSPTKMTLDHQRQSLHWFLTMVKQRQVLYENSDLVSDAIIQPNILTMSTNSWVPDHCQLEDLHKDMLFHIAHVLIKYIKPLEFLGSSYPEYIVHPYIEQTKQKSVILNCELVDASENSSQGMIEILQQVHNLTVPHKEGTLIEKVVFGGDVLTNERAFSAQSAMQNNKSDFDKLMGVIHRPEGLHRQFNFLLTIYQLFYKETSAVDRGSLYQLRNLINRRDVSGPKDVTQKFRPHQHFIEDVTDAYILASFWEVMEVEEEDGLTQKLPVFSIMNDEQLKKWINDLSLKIFDNLHLREVNNFGQINQDLLSLGAEDEQIEKMKVNNQYVCPFCSNSFSLLTWFKKHLKSKHNWNFHDCNKNVNPTSAVKHFVFMSLIFRDTCDAYRLADGNRIIRNAYFEWLYASAVKHSKYKIWLWRMISYVTSILNVKDSFEYKWNMCVNLKGGIGNSIPNDNAVEIQVCNIKRELNTQGANKSYQSARKICMTTQVIDKIKNEFMRTTKTARSKRERPTKDKTKDIYTMVQCLRQQGPISKFQWNSFSEYKDPIGCIDSDNLHTWINSQKKIASVYL